jgi:ATP adenylyltransferase
MDQLWTPWRYRYISRNSPAEDCIFCSIAAADPATDRNNLVLYRGRRHFLLLNLYPYTVGHSMIVPYAHVADLAGLDGEAMREFLELARDMQAALEKAYHPQGFNLGINLGRPAGAGIADHLHLHVVPRWLGDANFMSVIAETRVQPDDLPSAYDKLVGYFRR